MIVYSDSNVLDSEWLPIIDLGEYYLCHSFKEYVASTDPVKIAFTTHRLHCDHDINCTAYHGFEDKINKLSEVSKLVFTFESELHNFHWRMWDQCHHENVYWVVAGVVNDRDDMNKNIIYWGDWFKTTSNLYKQLPHRVEQIKSYNVKPKMFDALLGSPKPHRDFVYNCVQSNNLQDQFIIPYGGQWNDNEFYAKDYFVWEPGVAVIGNQQPGTAGPVTYDGVYTGLSRVIPLAVFNSTAYSIVAETDHDNTLSFWSEKTAKPFIARRLFVAFTGYKFLHNLRNLGFKTFNSIIDESYDLIIDDNLRYAAAFDQVKWLCTQPQQEIFEKLKPIAEHNFELIMSRDWTAYSAEKIRSVINSTVN